MFRPDEMLRLASVKILKHKIDIFPAVHSRIDDTMYVTPDEVREARSNSLELFSAFSNACLDAGDGFTELVLENSRQTLNWSEQFFATAGYGFSLHGSEAMMESLSAHPLGNSSRMQEEFYRLLEQIYKAVLKAAEAQIRICDQLLFNAIEHANRATPWEGEIALNALRATVKSAEATLHGVTDTAISSAEIAEQQIKQVADSLSSVQPAKKPAPRKRSPTKQ